MLDHAHNGFYITRNYFFITLKANAVTPQQIQLESGCKECICL